MPELEAAYASRVVLEHTVEVLQEQKADLDQKLATTSFRLMELHEKLQQEPVPITMKIRTAYNRFSDNGYVGGYDAYDQKTFIITSSYFITAYLGALAEQATAIEFPRSSEEKVHRYTTPDYASVALLQVAVGEDVTFEAPLSIVTDAFKASKKEAFDVVESLAVAVKEHNPYKDIPIKINQAELLDALLRIEILKYCGVHDPHFSIEESQKK